MKINMFEHTIVLTKKEMTAASRFGTKEYKDLQIAKSQNPGFQVVMNSRKVNRQCETYKGLTYAYMEKYIKAHDEDQSIMKEYQMLRGLTSEAQDALADSCTYQEIKNWFLGKFPAIAAFHTMRQNLLSAAN